MTALSQNAKEEIIESKDATNLKEASLIILWKSCDTLPIKVFYEILKTKNQKHLLEISQRNLNLSESQKIQLNNAWLDILDDYWQLSNPSKYKNNIRKTKDLLEKQNKLTTLKAILLKADLGINVVEDLKYWNIKSVEQCLYRTRVLKTKILLILAKVNDVSDTKYAYNFNKDYVKLIQRIKVPEIDKITVSLWIELNKIT